MRAWVPKWARSILGLRARDGSRFALNEAWVGLDPVGPKGTTTVIVTDGTMVARVRSRDPDVVRSRGPDVWFGDEAKPTKGCMIVEAEGLYVALGLLPRHPSHRPGATSCVEVIETDKRRSAIIPRHQGDFIDYGLHKIDGKFPKESIDGIFQQVAERDCVRVSLSVVKLKKALDAMNGAAKNATVKISVGSPTDPVSFQLSDPLSEANVEILLMPIKVD